MWVCIAMLLTTKPPVSAALAQAVCVRWAHMSQPMYKLHFIYLCDCKLAAIDEEEQKWECVKEEMQREKKKEEVFWQVMLLRGEERVTERDSVGGWLISQCSGTVTWSAPAPAAAELNPLNSLRPRLESMVACTHSPSLWNTHTQQHSQATTDTCNYAQYSPNLQLSGCCLFILRQS